MYQQGVCVLVLVLVLETIKIVKRLNSFEIKFSESCCSSNNETFIRFTVLLRLLSVSTQ